MVQTKRIRMKATAHMGVKLLSCRSCLLRRRHRHEREPPVPAILPLDDLHQTNTTKAEYRNWTIQTRTA